MRLRRMSYRGRPRRLTYEGAGARKRSRPSRRHPFRKDVPSRDLPRSRIAAEQRRQSDPHEAAAGRPGDRPGDGRPVGRGGRHEQEAPRARPDAEAENRLAKALWELGELGAAREHYQTALALDPTNRIAERNIDRLRV